jgi:mitochondrial fission protein ELM1
LNKTIWILSDGKAGHLSQTRGLATALQVRITAAIREVDLSGKGFLGKLGVIWKQKAEISRLRLKTTPCQGDRRSEGVGEPAFIIAAGHGMHMPLLLAGLLFRKAKTVLCMKPSLPMRWFDFCVVPRHDLKPALLAHPPAHVIPTLGALHGVHPHPERPKMYTLILIGGPSKEYGWNEVELIEQLTAVSSWQFVVDHQQAESSFLLTTSRRTPAGFVDAVRLACPQIEVVPVEETPRGWVAEKLASSREVWVTRDSVSMIYEALGSGAPVGLFKMPLLSQGKITRVMRGIHLLEQEGWVTPFDLWKQKRVLKSKGALVEVDRVAEIIASRMCSQ